MELTENAGMVLSVHSQDNMPFPEDEAQIIPPDTMTLVSIRLVCTPYSYTFSQNKQCIHPDYLKA